MKGLKDFKLENQNLISGLQLAKVAGGLAQQTSKTETGLTDSDTGPCDTRYYVYSDDNKVIRTYVL